MKKTANNFILYVYLFIIIISIILRSKVKEHHVEEKIKCEHTNRRKKNSWLNSISLFTKTQSLALIFFLLNLTHTLHPHLYHKK